MAVFYKDLALGTKESVYEIAHLRKEFPGISIPAIKQNGEWAIKPHDEIRIKADDLLIVSGTRESVETVRKL